MSPLLALVPKRYQHAAKAWVAAFSTVLVAVVAAVPVLPKWLAVLASIAGTLGVYGTPNVSQGDGDDDAPAS